MLLKDQILGVLENHNVNATLKRDVMALFETQGPYKVITAHAMPIDGKNAVESLLNSLSREGYTDLSVITHEGIAISIIGKRV